MVVDIEDSRSVTLQGFTINGGSAGVLCNMQVMLPDWQYDSGCFRLGVGVYVVPTLFSKVM